jgi:hypothetical protein
MSRRNGANDKLGKLGAKLADDPALEPLRTNDPVIRVELTC